VVRQLSGGVVEIAKWTAYHTERAAFEFVFWQKVFLLHHTTFALDLAKCLA